MDEYKIAIFHGDNAFDQDHGFIDGEIEKFGERLKQSYHILEFIDHIQKKYQDVPLLKGVKPTHPPYVPACFFTFLGDVVFYNIAPLDKKYGKIGQFYFPQSISDAQKKSILEFSSEISDYQIFLMKNIFVKDGELSWQTLTNMNEKLNCEFLENFFAQNYIEIRASGKKK